MQFLDKYRSAAEISRRSELERIGSPRALNMALLPSGEAQEAHHVATEPFDEKEWIETQIQSNYYFYRQMGIRNTERITTVADWCLGMGGSNRSLILVIRPELSFNALASAFGLRIDTVGECRDPRPPKHRHPSGLRVLWSSRTPPPHWEMGVYSAQALMDQRIRTTSVLEEIALRVFRDLIGLPNEEAPSATMCAGHWVAPGTAKAMAPVVMASDKHFIIGGVDLKQVPGRTHPLARPVAEARFTSETVEDQGPLFDPGSACIPKFVPRMLSARAE